MKLTDRELEIIEYVSQGYSNVTIGELMFRSVNTIRGALKNIYFKVGHHNRVLLAVKYVLGFYSKPMTTEEEIEETKRRG